MVAIGRAKVTVAGKGPQDCVLQESLAPLLRHLVPYPFGGDILNFAMSHT